MKFNFQLRSHKFWFGVLLRHTPDLGVKGFFVFFAFRVDFVSVLKSILDNCHLRLWN